MELDQVLRRKEAVHPRLSAGIRSRSVRRLPSVQRSMTRQWVFGEVRWPAFHTGMAQAGLTPDKRVLRRL